MKKALLGSLLAFTTLIPVYSNASISQVNSTYFATAQTINFETGISQVLPIVEGVRFIQETYPSNFFGTAGSGLFGVLGYTNIVVDPYGTPGFSDLAIEFNRPMTAVGGWIGNISNFLNRDAPLVKVSVFDQGYKLLAERDIDLLTSGASVFLGFTSDSGIGRIEWRGLNGGFFSVDNVVLISPSPIPVPAAWVLFLSGSFIVYLLPKRGKAVPLN